MTASLGQLDLLAEESRTSDGDEVLAAVSRSVVGSAPRTSTPRQQEIARLGDAAMRVLAFLKLRGERGALNWELSQPETGGLAGVRRVWYLQQHGWNITKEHSEGGQWRYTLRGLRS